MNLYEAVDRMTITQAHRLEKRMQDEYVEMYGEPDQDPDNHIQTTAGIFVLHDRSDYVALGGWGFWPNSDGKVKMLYVVPERRGEKLAQVVLTAMEAMMWKHGCRTVRFESGPKQQPAHRLYLKHGYRTVEEGFGFYKDNPGSVFFSKEL